MRQPFIHLHAHSEYSMSDGIIRISDYVKRAVELNMPAIALTDHVNLFALVKFYKKAIQAGIKPIIGADLMLKHADSETSHCTILCKNQQGYKNLILLLTRAYLEGNENHQPLVRLEWLFEAHQGLIVLSGGVKGDIGQALLMGNRDLAETRLEKWRAVFGDNFYLEIQRTYRDHEEDYLHEAVALAQVSQVAVVASNDIRFIAQEDFEAHEARVCIHDGDVLNNAKRVRRYSDQQYMKSSEAMRELFADIPEAYENTYQIYQRCSVTISLDKVFLPNFPIPPQQSVDDYFVNEAQRGLKMRLQKLSIQAPDHVKHYNERLKLECDVIIKMGFPGYFLIVADFIAWAKSQAIPVGPGRGSGAGSLCAFALGITELDPIEHDLLFERFLNPERVSLPDFDIDFCMQGRDRVIEYVARRYGASAVAQIITYGSMAAKAVVRDVGRVLGLPYGFVDKIAKLIPFELGITLQKALSQEERLLQRYHDEEEVQTLINLAMKLEGITRNAGKHAGGVVIAPTQLTDFVPLYCESMGEQAVTQFDKDDVEAVGLVKFDFLGLRTLTIIDWALQTINAKQTERIDISAIPLDDKPTFDLLKRCSTTAVFQLESRGMKELIRRLLPDNFDEITALVALFRPGPLQSGMVDDFIDRKHGRAKVHYAHPDLEPILRSTYGVILYQEQVMQIAQTLAGYTLGGADILRRAMGKKKPEEMAKQREIFTSGAAQRGIELQVAEYIFDLMEKFAGYGFNKSHSAAYALIAYQTAWLKTHFPAEFMAAVLSSDMDNTDKVVGFIDECRTMQLKVLSPNINEGFYHFTVNQSGEIVFGLGAIKGVGESLIQNLCQVRCDDGPYKNLFDFCKRVDLQKLSRRALEPLVRSGALDIFGEPRENLYASIEKALKFAAQSHRNLLHRQVDLFAMDERSASSSENLDYVTAEPWAMLQRLQGEKDTLGYYISGHPLDACESGLFALTTAKIAKLQTCKDSIVMIIGLILSSRVITTRAGKKMAILTVEDQTGRIDVTLFSEAYHTIAEQLTDARIVLLKGAVSHDDYTGGIKIVAEVIMTLEDVRARMMRCIKIKVDSHDGIDKLLTELPQLSQQFESGRTPIKIIYQSREAEAELRLGDAWRIKPSEEFLEKLYQLYGRDCIVLEYT